MKRRRLPILFALGWLLWSAYPAAAGYYGHQTCTSVVSPSTGDVCSDASGNIQRWNGSAWVAVNFVSAAGALQYTTVSANGTDYLNGICHDGVCPVTAWGPCGSTSLNAAITAAAVLPGLKILLPPGICSLSSPVSYTGTVPLTIEGAGFSPSTGTTANARSVLQATSGLTGAMLTLTGGASPLQGMILRDFTLDGNGHAANGLVCGDHGCDFSRFNDIEIKNATADGLALATAAHLISASWSGLIIHDNGGRGLFLQGTLNNNSIADSKFYYNYQAGGGEQIQCGIGASHTGPVAFTGATDMEDKSLGGSTTDIGLLDEGCDLTLETVYSEAHNGPNSTWLSIQPNTTGTPVTVNVIGGMSNGGSTSNYGIKLPATSNTSPIQLNVIGWSQMNYLCGSSCTSSRNSSANAPVSGIGGTLDTFNSSGNAWYPDTTLISFAEGTAFNTIFSVAGTPLPACAATMNHVRFCVSDATACTNGTTYAGSGSTGCLVNCNGTNWLETGAGCY